MPLRGEAQRRDTYTHLQRIPDGSQLVHRCTHAILGADCVQKTVPISSQSVAFFEPRLLEDLEHPRITPIREAQFDPELDNHVTFVMPWYAGGSVARALIEDHRFSLTEAVQIVRDVLDGLEYLHTRKRYVHRDVKSSNVLLEDGRTSALLSDFGLAAALDQSGDAPAVAATYEYMAPECAPTLRHSPRSDVYGAGMVLFELLNGRLEWEHLDRARIEQRVMSGRRALPDSQLAPRGFAPHVPPSLVRVTRKAISADPAARFVSAADFLRTLNQTRFIDWRHVEGDESEGVWEGTWPPDVRTPRRDRYRITSEVVKRGRAAGLRRVVATRQQRGTDKWRRIGIADSDLELTDADAFRKVFADVAESAAHRRAAS